jgi:dTDP-4-dehydrorhamnose reductase
MQYVIIGADGMLGSDLTAMCVAGGLPTLGVDYPEVDITEIATLEHTIPARSIVVNCAAYTQVDDAETDRARAFLVNGAGAGNVADVCFRKECRLLHLSTDYVFNGSADLPYREEDPTNPLNVYGESKLAGEERVREAGGDALVVRVQSLFGANGRNFVKTIIKKLRENGSDLRVVQDQVCSPTYTKHLASAILSLIEAEITGIVHVCASGSCSWHAFAVRIAEHVNPGKAVTPIDSSEFPTPARRPALSVMNTSRFESVTGRRMPSWEEGLHEYLNEVT